MSSSWEKLIRLRHSSVGGLLSLITFRFRACQARGPSDILYVFPPHSVDPTRLPHCHGNDSSCWRAWADPSAGRTDRKESQYERKRRSSVRPDISASQAVLASPDDRVPVAFCGWRCFGLRGGIPGCSGALLAVLCLMSRSGYGWWQRWVPAYGSLEAWKH